MRPAPRIHPRTTEDANLVSRSSAQPQTTVLREREYVTVDIDQIFNDMFTPEKREPRHVDINLLKEETTHSTYKMEDTMPIIWLDPDANEDAENKVVQDQLKALTKSLKVFITEEECEEYIRQLEIGEQIILIVAGSIGTVVIPLVHDSTQVNVIFMYARQKKYYDEKLKKKNYSKVREVIDDPTTLIIKVRNEQDIYRTVDENEISVNIYNLNEKLRAGKPSDANWRFIWMYSFMNMLLHISPSLPSSIADIEKNQLVKILRTFYNDNTASLKQIQRFEEEYSPNKAIYWYSTESPLYRMLNKALRERDLKLLLPFRFFIFNIYEQLLDEHQQYDQDNDSVSDRTQPISIVYRAQFMPSYTVLRMKNSIGGYVSINSFLSTSLKRDVVLPFVDTSRRKINKDLQSVIFEIHIDPNLQTLPYARISKFSMFPSEEEVLFSPGIILKIQDIYNDNTDNNLCVMRLKLCSENEDELSDIVSYWKQNIESQTDLTSFGWLLMQTGQLKQVKNFYKMLLGNLSDNDSLIRDCYNGLGNVYLEQNQLTKAIDCHKEAINISEQIPNDQKRLAKGYSYLADAYKANNEMESALKYFEKALKKFGKIYTKAHRDTAKCYSNIGTIYQKQKNYDQALKSFKTALELNEEIDSNDPNNLIVILKSLSQIHCLKIQFSDALTYLRRALKICQKTLKTNDPEIGSLHENIGDIHLKCEEFIFALSSYHKAAEIYYYSYAQQEEHNLEIQRIIKYCNVQLKKKDNTIKSSQPLVSTNVNQFVPQLNQPIDPHVRQKTLTTISANGRTNQIEPIQRNRHIPSPAESVIVEDLISTNNTTTSARSSRKTRENVIEQNLNLNQRTLNSETR